MASRRRVQPSHFFKVILNSTLEGKKLKIPEKFARIFGDEVPSVATLTIPNGGVWTVGLTKNGREIWFDNGWHDFVQYNSVSVGYFLVFKYNKNSSFNVIIFDTTACEIEYSCRVVEEPENVKQNSLHQDEMENEDSVEVIDLTVPNPPSNSLKNKVSDDCPRSSSKVQPQTSQQNPTRSSFAAASLGSPESKCGYDKSCKMEELEEKDKSTRECINIKRKNTASAYKVGRRSPNESNKRSKFDEDQLLVLLEDMGICVNRNIRNITTEKKERAIAAARLFKPKNPSFMVILRTSDIRNHCFYVPAEFGHRYFSKIRCLKVLDSEGRKWPVEITWRPRCFITRLGGITKMLDEGDVCVFELISRMKLKISILDCIKSESSD